MRQETLGHNYVGTEHLLLSLIREGEGVAARILKDSGVDLQHVREQIIRLLKEEGWRTTEQGQGKIRNSYPGSIWQRSDIYGFRRETGSGYRQGKGN
jgi:ATP-dependent Clp protease ATP-binding subunit ClpA